MQFATDSGHPRVVVCSLQRIAIAVDPETVEDTTIAGNRYDSSMRFAVRNPAGSRSCWLLRGVAATVHEFDTLHRHCHSRIPPSRARNYGFAHYHNWLSGGYNVVSVVYKLNRAKCLLLQHRTLSCGVDILRMLASP